MLDDAVVGGVGHAVAFSARGHDGGIEDLIGFELGLGRRFRLLGGRFVRLLRGGRVRRFGGGFFFAAAGGEGEGQKQGEQKGEQSAHKKFAPLLYDLILL